MLKIRPFRRLWIVLGVASLGDWLGLLATATFASAQVTGSAAKGLAFGSVIAVRLLPALVLGPVAGVLADRFDRRYTMAICDVLRFFLFASIPLVALQSTNSTLTIGWAAVATFLIETITLIWIPAKEAAVPNLIPRGRLEDANQLTLITTYGITPVLAALGLAGLNQIYHSVSAGGVSLPETTASAVALYFNALSRLATAVVVFYGIREISGSRDGRQEAAQQSALRQFVDGWRYIARSPLVRGLVLGILGAFACGGLVIGTAQFYARSLSGGDSTFYLLFGLIFIGLGLGIALGPRLIGQLSRRRWFGLSIMLAAVSVAALALAPHLSVAAVGTLLVGAGAGMAFLSGTTLLGGEVEDEVRGRVFAFVQTSVRVVLMLAIALSGVLVGAGGSPEISINGATVPISSTRVLLFIAGIFGTLAGYWALRQMDDKPGVPLLPDIWASMRGRPLGLIGDRAASGMFIVFEGGEGAGKSTQIDLLAEHLRARGREVLVTREPGATPVGARIRQLLLETHSPEGTLSALGPRSEALLYAADRAHHVDSVVRPALDRGVVVISDRYIDSSLAYQGAGRTLDAEEVAWLSSWATEGLKPELTVLLDIDPRIGLDRVAERGDGHDRLESEAISFHDRVRFAFLKLADAEPGRYLVVDASLPVEQVGVAVAEKVDRLLPPLHETDVVPPTEEGDAEQPTFRAPERTADRAEVTAELATEAHR
ncbi:MAG: dTMP kinase [Hamadaea sp.]|uniref:dTMP kinase n=1 Tax=Hamadaea sp. TaxID=2024425 RepID=UPI0017B33849|nr:dTMP kinase [Hamadaea sp.]NUT19369.1 dTMP kinase [Hamadaea sp.]